MILVDKYIKNGSTIASSKSPTTGIKSTITSVGMTTYAMERTTRAFAAGGVSLLLNALKNRGIVLIVLLNLFCTFNKISLSMIINNLFSSKYISLLY